MRLEAGGIAVVVHCEPDDLIVLERRVIEGDILNALAGGLGEIDFIVHTSEHIIQVAGVILVEGDVDVAGLPLGITSGGPFHVALKLLARDVQAHQGVIKLVDVKDVAVVDVARRQIAGILKQGAGGDVRVGGLQLDLQNEIHDGGVLQLAFGQTDNPVSRLELGGGGAEDIVVDKVDGLLMHSGDRGDGTQLSAGFQIGHIDDLNPGVGDFVILTDREVEARDLGGGILHAADGNVAAHLVDGGVGMPDK